MGGNPDGGVGAGAESLQIPALIYHSVADDHSHPWSQLSLSVELFERQLRYLDRHGFRSVTLRELYDHLAHGSALPRKPVLLTFDDGFLDNWVHAFPLLERYGMRATVFVATDFIDPCERCRPTLADVWSGDVAREELSWWGYLSWPELRQMCDSGLVDVQSHTRTHTWYFSGERILDFHHPGDPYPWLDWNARPERKPGWLSRMQGDGVPWGTPVYEHTQTLLGRRYFEDPELSALAVEHVRGAGGAGFFRRNGWRDELHEVIRAGRGYGHGGGRFETPAERESRLVDELQGSRRLLEAGLDRAVEFLCWPGGDYTPALLDMAVEKCGYLAAVDTVNRSNQRGQDPRDLHRVYFGQDYQGPLRDSLVFLHFWGTLNHRRGVRAAYPVAPVARRLMRLGRAVAEMAR